MPAFARLAASEVARPAEARPDMGRPAFARSASAGQPPPETRAEAGVPNGNRRRANAHRPLVSRRSPARSVTSEGLSLGSESMAHDGGGSPSTSLLV